ACKLPGEPQEPRFRVTVGITAAPSFPGHMAGAGADLASAPAWTPPAPIPLP
ncbi:hypothetical protein P7K49_015008, partial [Saguinus oedipus]